jgi:hypothetical protein
MIVFVVVVVVPRHGVSTYADTPILGARVHFIDLVDLCDFREV